MEENQRSSRFDIILTFLLALVVLIAAIVTWRASLIDDAAGDADYDGLRASVRAFQTRALSNVNAYESYGNYVTYWRNKELSALIANDMAAAGEEQAPVLEAQIKMADDLTDANSGMFEMRYLNRDGSYSVQRQLGETWADALRKNRVEYLPSFANADRDRARTRTMLVALMILTITPVFYALVSSAKGKTRIILFSIGTFCMLTGSVVAVLVELGKL
jgi:hypothetical protein